MTQTLQESGKTMKKRSIFVKILIILLIIAIGGALGGKYYLENQLKPVSASDPVEKEIEIPRGSSTIGIATILEDNGIIRNKYIFRIVAKLQNKDGSLKAGKYVLNTGMTHDEILDRLIKGGTLRETVSFTIPEGFELRQIADRLSGQGLVNRERFIELTSSPKNFWDEFEFLREVPEELTLEGFLYPDTYEIFKGATEEDIIKRMLSRFAQLYTGDIQAKAEDLGLNLNQLITLASIIEREGMVDSEREIISGVFHNRLQIGMNLQSCATVQYILGERKENLSIKDTQIDSKFNTYVYSGLPPGPIASPGIKSIIAAAYPAEVPYLFFVANGDGSHTFSTTYNAHLDAKNRR